MIRRLIFCLASGLAIGLVACENKPPTSPSTTSSNCSFTVSEGPTGFVAAAGTEFTVTIGASASCSWTATSGSPFITPLGPTTGSGDGSVRFTVQANSGIARQGSVQVASRTILVNQSEGSPCQFAVSPRDIGITIGGGDVGVDVTASASGCGWTTTSGSAFVTIKQGLAGTGDGHVVLTVAPNAGDFRIGQVNIAGHIVSVLQDSALPPPIPCEFVVSPTRFDVSANSVPGYVVTITKTSGVTCPWVATSTASWITLRNSSGVNSGTVTFDVAGGSALSARNASIRFGNSPGAPRTDIYQGVVGSAPGVAVISYTSDPGDPVGLGGSDSITVSDGKFFFNLDSALTLRVPNGSFYMYDMTFAGANGAWLTPGIHNRAARYPFQPAGAPGLTFMTNARGCVKLTGRILVATADFIDARLQRLHLRFEQHCEGWSTPLRGIVWIDSGGALPPPPIADFPPAPASPVTTLSYNGDAGDPISGGGSATLTLNGLKASAWAGASDPSVQIRMQSVTGSAVNWSLDFEGPSGTRLMPGTYNNATRYPSNPNGTPGLNISGNGASCSSLTGSFVVTEAEYGPQGEVLRFHATFEQRCGANTAARRGEIRIVADPWK